MSLINDALKRASQAQPPSLPESEKVAPMQPVEIKRPPAWPLFVVPVVLLLVLAVAAWFLLKGWSASQRANLNSINTPVSAREFPAENQAWPQPDLHSSEPGGASRNRPAGKQILKGGLAEEGKSALIASQEVAAASAPTAPVFPALRLQGLFYRSTRPSAVINSKTLCVGERIEDAKVVAIERDSVVVEWGGEKRVLTLN